MTKAPMQSENTSQETTKDATKTLRTFWISNIPRYFYSALHNDVRPT